MGNGRSPAGLTLEAVRERGVHGGALPPFHALTVTVPGAAAAWEDAVRLWGKLSLQQVCLRCRSCLRVDKREGQHHGRGWGETGLRRRLDKL